MWAEGLPTHRSHRVRNVVPIQAGQEQEMTNDNDNDANVGTSNSIGNDNEVSTKGERIDGWTAERRTKFLDRLAQTANVAVAARSVKKSISGAYQLRRRDPEFARAWEAALAEALDELETVVLERVVNGVEKAIFYGGKQCGTVRQYSDALAMFMLKAHRPELYGRVTALAEDPDGKAAADSQAELGRRLKALGDRLKAA
jgi:hypothetical protein